MNLDNIDRVKKLGENRKLAQALRDAASNGLIECKVWSFGTMFEAQNVISIEFLRQAVIDGCTELIKSLDKELVGLGVHIKDIDRSPKESVASLRCAIDMYVRAWIRELGGKLVPKAHLIDALVLTTRQLASEAVAERRRLSALITASRQMVERLGAEPDGTVLAEAATADIRRALADLDKGSEPHA